MLQINRKYESCIDIMSNKMGKTFNLYLVVIIYKLLLDLLYYYIIGDQNSFFYIKVSPILILSGWIFVLLMPPILKIFYEQERPSSIIMIVWYMIYFIPITTYCGLAGGSSSFLFFSFIYCGILSLLQVKVPLFVLKTNNKKVSDKGMYISIAIVSIILLYVWAKYSKFRILTNIIDVYDVRAEASGYAMPVALSYFISMAPILISLAMLYALANKKKFILLWSLFLIVISFSYAGQKTVLFMPCIMIGGYLFYRKGMIKLIMPMGIVLGIFAFIEYFLGSIYISSLLFRRNAFVLAQLSDFYYRFFNDHSVDFFRNSIMGKFGFESIWQDSISKVIGNNFETQVINCNNGLLADVWANLGIIGIVIMPIILIICLRIFDFATQKLEIRVSVGLAVFYAFTFANSTWSTVLISHGLIVVCVILFLFPKKERELS